MGFSESGHVIVVDLWSALLSICTINVRNRDMKKTYLLVKWKAWECLLSVTGWLFGYGHDAYYGVKDNRNKAYFKYIFRKGRL